MAEQDEEKLWLLKDLFEIPVLTCDVQKLDFTAIMSRFHFLLLEQDKETYEEFVKYWALLIVTAPDIFKAKELWGNQLFSKVYSDASKFNLLEEEIELPLGHARVEKAGKFQDRIWKRYMEGHIPSRMDDTVVYEWYTDPANTFEARAFFGLYCLNLMKAYISNSPSSIVTECGSYDRWTYCSNGSKPPKFISFNTGTAIFLRDAFRSQAETFRKILRMELDWSLSLPNTSDRRADDYARSAARFHEYVVEQPMCLFGLTILNPKLFAWRYQLESLETYIENITSDKVASSMRNLVEVISYLDGVLSQEGIFLQENPNYIGQSCKLWSYSRLLSPQYFKSVADEDNLEFLAFSVGLANNHLDSNAKKGIFLEKLNKIDRMANIKLGCDACDVQVPGGFKNPEIQQLRQKPLADHNI